MRLLTPVLFLPPPPEEKARTMAHFHAFVTLPGRSLDDLREVLEATQPQLNAGLFDWVDRVVAEVPPEEAARCVEAGERVCIVMADGKSWSRYAWDQQHHESGPLPHPDAVAALRAAPRVLEVNFHCCPESSSPSSSASFSPPPRQKAYIVTHPQIRRAISVGGVAVGLVCLALDIRRGAPAFWPMLTILAWQFVMWGVQECDDRRWRP